MQNQNPGQMNNNINNNQMNNNMNNRMGNMNNQMSMMNNQMNNNMNNNMNNQMNNNMNNVNYVSPNLQKIQSTLSQIMPNSSLINIDFGNMNNTLLSLINSSIIVIDHPHPLYCCLTPQKRQYSQFWTCSKCRCNYMLDVPSFYCTFCNIDLCQKCFLQYPVYQIELYNYRNGNYNFNNLMGNQNDPNLRMNIHKHPLKLIQIMNYNSQRYNINCMNCRNNIKNTDNFLYCSLCNFYVCTNCFMNSNQPQMMNQQFNNQMNNNQQNQFQGQFGNQNPNFNPQMNFNQNQQNQQNQQNPQYQQNPQNQQNQQNQQNNQQNQNQGMNFAPNPNFNQNVNPDYLSNDQMEEGKT